MKHAEPVRWDEKKEQVKLLLCSADGSGFLIQRPIFGSIDINRLSGARSGEEGFSRHSGEGDR
jgi:hypothetical protein